jgi:hypothetical protein
VINKRDEITGEWRRLHNEELYALYSSPNIIRVIKSRRLGWIEHVARMWKRTIACSVWVGKPEVRSPLERPRCIWKDNIKMDRGNRLNRSGSGWEQVACSREYGDKPSSSIKCGEFLE